MPFLVAGALVADEPERLLWAVAGGAGALVFFLLLHLGWRGAMGEGDVRLAALLGLFLGWIGPMHVPVGLFLGFLAGALAGVGVMRGSAQWSGRKTAHPVRPVPGARRGRRDLVGTAIDPLLARRLSDVLGGRHDHTFRHELMATCGVSIDEPCRRRAGRAPQGERAVVALSTDEILALPGMPVPGDAVADVVRRELRRRRRRRVVDPFVTTPSMTKRAGS